MSRSIRKDPAQLAKEQVKHRSKELKNTQVQLDKIKKRIMETKINDNKELKKLNNNSLKFRDRKDALNVQFGILNKKKEELEKAREKSQEATKSQKTSRNTEKIKDTLHAHIDKARENMNELQKLFGDQRKDRGVEQNRKNDLIKNLSNLLKRAKEVIENIRSAADFDKRIKKLDQQMNQTEKYLDKLKIELKKEEGLSQKRDQKADKNLSEIEKNIRDLKSEIDRNKKQDYGRKKEHEMRLKKHRGDIDRLRRELTKDRDVTKEKGKEIGKGRERRRELNEKLKGVRDDIERVRGELARERDITREKGKEIDKDRERRRELDEKLKGVRDDIERVRGELARERDITREKGKEIDKDRERRRELNEKLKGVHDDIERVRGELAKERDITREKGKDVDREREKRRRLKERLEGIREDIDRLRKELAANKEITSNDRITRDIEKNEIGLSQKATEKLFDSLLEMKEGEEKAPRIINSLKKSKDPILADAVNRFHAVAGFARVISEALARNRENRDGARFTLEYALAHFPEDSNLMTLRFEELDPKNAPGLVKGKTGEFIISSRKSPTKGKRYADIRTATMKIEMKSVERIRGKFVKGRTKGEFGELSMDLIGYFSNDLQSTLENLKNLRWVFDRRKLPPRIDRDYIKDKLINDLKKSRLFSDHKILDEENIDKLAEVLEDIIVVWSPLEDLIHDDRYLGHYTDELNKRNKWIDNDIKNNEVQKNKIVSKIDSLSHVEKFVRDINIAESKDLKLDYLDNILDSINVKRGPHRKAIMEMELPDIVIGASNVMKDITKELSKNKNKKESTKWTNAYSDLIKNIVDPAQLEKELFGDIELKNIDSIKALDHEISENQKKIAELKTKKDKSKKAKSGDAVGRQKIRNQIRVIEKGVNYMKEFRDIINTYMRNKIVDSVDSAFGQLQKTIEHDSSINVDEFREYLDNYDDRSANEALAMKERFDEMWQEAEKAISKIVEEWESQNEE